MQSAQHRQLAGMRHRIRERPLQQLLGSYTRERIARLEMRGQVAPSPSAPPRYCARNPVALGASTLPKGLQVSRSDRRPTSRFPGPFLPLDLDLEEIQRLLQVPQLLFDIALVGREQLETLL